MWIYNLSILGIILSLYLLNVRQSKTDSYCDINNYISCSAVARSTYSKLFGIENAKIGIIFYLAIFILAATGLSALLQIISSIAVMVSLYLLYIMLFEVRKICIICLITDAINIAIVIIAFKSF
jgi:uncharacterized membrane protein